MSGMKYRKRNGEWVDLVFESEYTDQVTQKLTIAKLSELENELSELEELISGIQTYAESD